MAKSSPTIEYLRGRERVLGGMWLHRDPELAADTLMEKLGGRRFAIAWLTHALEHLERG